MSFFKNREQTIYKENDYFMDSPAVQKALKGLEEGQRKKIVFKAETAYNTFKFGISLDREQLYERINKRVDIMREQGLTEEVERLWKLGIENTPTASQAIGYKEFFEYLDDKKTSYDVSLLLS